MAAAFWRIRVMGIVKKHDFGDLIWKKIKLTSTRKANAKEHLHLIFQVLIPFFFNAKTFFLLGFLPCCLILYAFN
ncbi:hypothetical protein E1A91_A06G110200v1 [Gossypium mustelinum]|uniref:Uncharacterized protein n=1 Tax=Gossypium mustelinum TaxID=34275 RepID=A0A5D2YVC7_GOSMU|nr:hypothetical protein E1A91_A06G110200v1 [Gossypium mustelinum]